MSGVMCDRSVRRVCGIGCMCECDSGMVYVCVGGDNLIFLCYLVFIFEC